MRRILQVAHLGLITAVMAFGGFWIYGQVTTVAQARSTSQRTNSSAVNEAALSDTVRSIIANNNDLDIGVTITDVQTNKSYHWGETASYTAASLGKIITACAYLNQVEQGSQNLNDDIEGLSGREQLTRLITNSDNDAWAALNDQLTADGIEAYAASIGLSGYAPDTNLLTSSDIADVLAKLYQGSLLDKNNTAFLLSLLKNANMRDYIVAAIPSGTTVYHKVGYLDDRLNEAAIITRNNRSYVLTIFSKTTSGDEYDFSRGGDVFGAITKASLQAFFP